MTQPEQGADAGSAPLVDRSAIDPIMKVTGAAVMRRIVAAFWDTTGEMTGALRAAIDSGDLESIRRAAHALKGAASNVGAGRTARIAAVIEHADAPSALALLAPLEQSLQDTRPALDAVLADAA